MPPGASTQNPADRVKDDVEILGGVGRGNSWFDPFAFAVVSEARLGNSGFNSMRGPGRTQWDIGLFRQINLGGQRSLQLRVEAFNVTNTPHFSNPGANRSSLQLNPDGTIRNLNGYTEITSTSGQQERAPGPRRHQARVLTLTGGLRPPDPLTRLWRACRGQRSKCLRPGR